MPLSVQYVPITTKVVSSNPVHGRYTPYNITLYLMKLVSDLPQFSGFHRAIRFLPPIIGRHDITEILRGAYVSLAVRFVKQHTTTHKVRLLDVYT